MIEIKNISNELLTVLENVDESVPGCRIKVSPFGAIYIRPGETIAFLGYEPGVSRIIRPASDPHIPRYPIEILGEQTN